MLPEALAALPEDQKVSVVVCQCQEHNPQRHVLQALIMRVIAMSRDEVYQLPPADRENIIKLVSVLSAFVTTLRKLLTLCSHQRTTLGLPT